MHSLILRPARRTLAFLALGAVLAAGLVAGASTAAQPASAQLVDRGEFVGRVADSDAFVGLVVDVDRVIAYICDGTADGAHVATWYKGTIVNGRALLTAANGQEFSLDLADRNGLGGNVVLPGGEARDFFAERAVGDAGLFRADVPDRNALGGWIALNDGEIRGALAERDDIGGTLVERSLQGAPNFDPRTGLAIVPGFGQIQAAKVTFSFEEIFNR